MFSFRVSLVIFTLGLLMGLTWSPVYVRANSPGDWTTMGSPVSIPISELTSFTGIKSLQYNPEAPSAKCRVPGELFAPGALLDVARLETDGSFEVHFPHAQIEYEEAGTRHAHEGAAILKMEGLILEGRELLANCRIRYEGDWVGVPGYTISLQSEGAMPASTLVTTARAKANTVIEPEGEEIAVNVNISAPHIGTIAGSEGETGEAPSPEDEEGSLGEPLQPSREGYEPLGPGLEIDRNQPEAQPGDKIFIAEGNGAGVSGERSEATDQDNTSQKLVTLGGSGCSLQSTGDARQRITYFLLAFLFFSLPLWRRSQCVSNKSL